MMLRRPRSALMVLGLLLTLNTPVAARTFIVPYFVQTDDSPVTQYTLNTSLQLTYVPGLVDLEPVSSATVDVYLFEPGGFILESATAQPVCNPCSFVLNAGQRRTSVSLHSLVMNAGGFASQVASGFILLKVSGDADHVALGSLISNTHTSAFDFDLAVQKVIEVPGGLSPTGRLIVFPYIAESDGPTTNAFEIDNLIYAAYAGGITGSPIPAGSGATLTFWLFENNGTPMQSIAATNVCAPCMETISAADPHATFNVQLRFDAAGGGSPVELGFALLVITGNADAVAVEGLLRNSHTSTFDASTAELEQVEVPYSPPPTSVQTPPARLALRAFPNPLQASTRIDYSIGRDGAATVEIIDVRGRVVARPVNRRHSAGAYGLDWNGRDDTGALLPSGVYFARLVTVEGTEVIKMTVLH